MQLNIRTILEELNFTPNETSIISELISESSLTGAEIARRHSLDKSSAYRAIEHLVELGVIIPTRKKRGTTYTLTSLNIFKSLILSQKSRLDTQLNSLDQIINQLKSQSTNSRNTFIRVEKGLDAHLALMEQSLDCQERVIREKFPLRGPIFDSPTYNHYAIDFLHRRTKRGIRALSLYNFKGSKFDKKFMQTNSAYLKEVRILPIEMDNNNYLKIWDDNVEIISFTEDKLDFVVISLKDRFVAGLMKSFFDFVWQRSATYYNSHPLPTRKVGNTTIPVMGIGTWGVGGYATHNPYTDDIDEVQELRHALSAGMTYLDTSHAYAAGYSLPLIRQAISNFPRDSIFVTCKVGYPVDSRSGLRDMVKMHLDELGLDYFDMLQIHSPLAISIPIPDAIAEIDDIIDQGKAKYLSVSNFNVDQLKEVNRVARHPLVAHELHYNLMIRANEENGVVDYCRKNKILLIAFQPLRRGFLAGLEDPLLAKLAKKYAKTQAQIILNWLSHKPEFMFLVKSTRGSHINENVAALNWDMTQNEYRQLDSWRAPEYTTPPYDKTGQRPDGLKIWKL